MTGFNKRVYEMFVRVLVFATTYPQLFAKGTLTGELKDQIEAAVQKLSNHAASQLSGKGSVKRAAGDRAKARKALRDQLESTMNATIEQSTSIAKHFAVPTEQPSPVPAQLP
jgi:hypothetical protein